MKSFVFNGKKSFQIFIALFFVFALVTIPFSSVFAQIPFGGPIITYQPICQIPPGILLTIGPPTPMILFYTWGASISFMVSPPAHPGQLLLGMAGGWVPCIVELSGVPVVVGGGLMILFHGSSV